MPISLFSIFSTQIISFKAKTTHSPLEQLSDPLTIDIKVHAPQILILDFF